ncbi:SAM-dependent RNA methyltransferase [Emydomyces testavorans]|uniref:SAM-dependent RNA methyltransferase n=1 Tax=Emydomyces testavorans TaxID=2070801 RepID=A0AAF0IKI8_9EURO|nr:SAM-dependent RNA methyltransferase [Emydomyces testavorans]
MSLYFDAVSILTAPSDAGGSLKSRIYNSHLKSSPPQIYALITEVTKWNAVLKEVVDNSNILAHEAKLTPLLSLLLVHDYLLSKKGIAAPASHPLRLAVERHKTRLNAELTKSRIRRGCASVEELRSRLAAATDQASGNGAPFDPRWVRINNACTTLAQELKTTFASYAPVVSLTELPTHEGKGYYLDEHIPDLLATASTSQLLSTRAYKEGKIILQDKASCFPAYLLLGDQAASWRGDLMDSCAAPGNKTTHLASLLCVAGQKKSKIYSLDASHARSKTLQKMVGIARVDDRVTVLAGQDFLALDPHDPRFKGVTGLLLDPSCSGSGIVKREDVPQLDLPQAKARNAPGPGTSGSSNRKRKRKPDAPALSITQSSVLDSSENEPSNGEIDIRRLTRLSNLQVQIIEHAFRFPSAIRVTYSTCSIHAQENENVVYRALKSPIARERGWKILRRVEQVEGLRKWKHRGWLKSEHRLADGEEMWELTATESDACLRCLPGDEEGTGGFFVAGFVRENDTSLVVETNIQRSSDGVEMDDGGDSDGSDETWEGFDTD